MATESELTITDTTPGSNISDVKILMIGEKSIKHNFVKELIVIAIPGQSTPSTLLIDLGRLKEVITVTGVLENESGDTHYQKKDRLRQLMQRKGTMSISWDTNETDQPYTVNIIKAEITESPGEYGTESDTKFFDISMQFAIGTHKG